MKNWESVFLDIPNMTITRFFKFGKVKTLDQVFPILRNSMLGNKRQGQSFFHVVRSFQRQR